MRTTTVFVIVLALGLPAPVLAQGGRKIQCWTDAQGQRACGDRVPPEFAQQERRVYGSDGRLVEIKERPRTPEELAAIEAQKKEDAEARRKEQEQRAYDQFLLSTFNNVRDLEKMRDQRLSTMDGRIDLAQKVIDESQATLKRLRAQAARAEAGDKKVPERVQKQIVDFDKSVNENLQALAQMRVEREQIESRFAADIERLKALRQAAGLPPA